MNDLNPASNPDSGIFLERLLARRALLMFARWRCREGLHSLNAFQLAFSICMFGCICRKLRIRNHVFHGKILQDFHIGLRFGFCRTLCASIHYVYLLTYLFSGEGILTRESYKHVTSESSNITRWSGAFCREFF